MIWNLAVVISSSNINSSAFGELYSVPKVTKSLRHSNTIGHKIILTSHNGVRYKGFAGSPMSTLMRGRDELSAWSPMPTPVSGSRLKTHFSYFKFSISTILLNNSCWRWIIPPFFAVIPFQERMNVPAAAASHARTAARASVDRLASSVLAGTLSRVTPVLWRRRKKTP